VRVHGTVPFDAMNVGEPKVDFAGQSMLLVRDLVWRSAIGASACGTGGWATAPTQAIHVNCTSGRTGRAAAPGQWQERHHRLACEACRGPTPHGSHRL